MTSQQEKEFRDFYWETGKYKKRELGIDGYIDFINKLLKEENKKTIQWAEKYVERDMKIYGTDKHGVALKDLIDYLKN